MGSRHPNQRTLSSLPVELRRAPVPPDALAWVERNAGSAVDRVRRLPGTSTAAVHLIALESGVSLVLRRYVWRGFLEHEPDAPSREIDALLFAHREGLKVPEVVAADLIGADAGGGAPAILATYLPGKPIAAPDPNHLADVAASIHAINADALGHEYFPWCRGEMTSPPTLTTQPDLWERSIDLWHNAMPTYQTTFVHRDFHPGNLLWSRGRLIGIVDWVNACRGPAGCDLAHCRVNLRDLAGPGAAAAFVAAYESITGHPLDPYWIMAAHLEHDCSHWTAARLAADEPDLAAAVRALSRGG